MRGVTKMTRDGSLVGAVPAPVLLPKNRWLAPTLQSIALMLLLCGMTLGGWSLYLGLPLAVLIVWLPRLRSRAIPEAVPADTSRRHRRVDPRPFLHHQP